MLSVLVQDLSSVVRFKRAARQLSCSTNEPIGLLDLSIVSRTPAHTAHHFFTLVGADFHNEIVLVVENLAEREVKAHTSARTRAHRRTETCAPGARAIDGNDECLTSSPEGTQGPCRCRRRTLDPGYGWRPGHRHGHRKAHTVLRVSERSRRQRPGSCFQSGSLRRA